MQRRYQGARWIMLVLAVSFSFEASTTSPASKDSSSGSQLQRSTCSALPTPVDVDSAAGHTADYTGFCRGGDRGCTAEFQSN